MTNKSEVKTVDCSSAGRGRRSRRARLCSAVVLAFALVGCAVVDDDPPVTEQAAPLVEAGGPATPAAFQVVWACFGPSGRIGLPKSTLAACQAACPAPASCIRC